MNRKLSAFILSFFLVASGHAQQVRPAASGTVYHEIAQLRNLATVLYVAAHPDDENTRLLAYLVNDQHIRTGYLSLTRGDGGQNLLGTEQGEALGLIRTHELIEARKLDGAAQFFSRAVDFGFSKTYEETFRHWPKEVLADDAIWIMRNFRPDVVICRFPPDTNAGHGQHAASAIIAEMAYKMSGDKHQYTEQLHFCEPWQPKRLLFNTFKFGNRNTTSEDQFKIQVGQYVPSLGMGVGELAGQSRSVHKSQGAGTPSVPGMQTEYFKLVAGEPVKKSLFDGIDITWNRVGRADIGVDLDKILAQFDFKNPDAITPALLTVRKKITEVKDPYWRKLKLQEIDQVILHCAGIMAELYTKQPEAARGAQLPFTLRVIARSNANVRLTAINWMGSGDTAMNMCLSMDTLHTFEHNITIPATAPLTQPYWLQYQTGGNALYFMPPDSSAGMPETPNALQANLHFTVGGTSFSIAVPLSFKKLDPVKGDVVEQLRIVPDMVISFSNKLLIADSLGNVRADMRIHANKDITGASMRVLASISSTPVAEFYPLNLNKGTDTLIAVKTKAPAGITKDFYIVPQIAIPDVQEQHLIQYDHLPVLQYFTRSMARAMQPTWKCAARHIGYVQGAGDLVPELLRAAGLEVDVLKESDLAIAANLKKYDAIITGIRAVNAEKKMALWLPVLLQYAEEGGTLVMQYNTLQDMSTTRLGPYPITLSAKRVTEEDATVSFPVPEHRLLHYPNEITKDDFSDWVQERGLYFPTTWDSRYTALFSMHDEGEQPLEGGTLYTKTGKGHYIYTSLSFSRQLPAGNKGAIRLLMNILSVGK